MKLALRTLLAAAVVALPTLAAHAETKPTIVVIHRNIQNANDEQNWQKLAAGLAHDGFTVLSIAERADETTQQGKDQVMHSLAANGFSERVLFVGTASVSDTVSSVAQTMPARVAAVVYVSDSEAVPTFGPRSVQVPAGLAVPTFQVKVVSAESRPGMQVEGGTTFFKVREEGLSTLGRTEEMVDVLDRIATIARKHAQVLTASR